MDLTSASDQSSAIEGLVEEFDITAPVLVDEHAPFALYRELRSAAPIKKLEKTGRFAEDRDWWFVSRYADVQSVFQDDENFTSEEMTAGGIPGPIPTDPLPLEDVDPFLVASHSQKIPLALDPPEFSKYRPLLNPLFSPGQARKTESRTRQVADELISQIVGRPEAEFHHELGKPLPAMVICRVLGLPSEEWERWAITTPDTSGYSGAVASDDQQAIINRVIPSVDAQMTMLRLADERRRDPQDDIITAVAHLTADGGRLLNFYELGAILSVLLSGGVHTTTLAIEAALAHIGRNPDIREALVSEPEKVKPFCEEVLRMWPPLHSFFRTASRDVSVGGQPIKSGDGLLLGIASANRDPGEFPDPDTFNIARHPNRHITFAVGIHRCLGSSLARQEFAVTIEEVLRRLPAFSIDEARTSIAPHLNPVLYEPDRRLTAVFDV